MTPDQFSENLERPIPEGNPDAGQAIEEGLKRLPGELAQAIRSGAIPHRFNADLLARLLSSIENIAVSADQAGILLQQMQRFDILAQTSSGWFTYHEQLRKILLRGLFRQPALYKSANATAADFFCARMEREGNPNPESDQLEFLYHHLAADEPSGLPLLRRYFINFTQTNRLGLAEQLITYAHEQRPVLSSSGQEWLLYLTTQVKFGQAGWESSCRVFEELAARATDPMLRATAHRGLGEALIWNQRWAESIAELKIALHAFQQKGDHLEVANAQALLGNVFVSLAESAGGLRDELPLFASSAERWFYYLQHAPFLVYRWFSRRFAFFPNFYFGDNYQNWIIVRYLNGAIRWLTRADQTLRLVAQNDGAGYADVHTRIRIRLADLMHRVGRWSKAERRFGDLAQDRTVNSSPYLRGLVLLGQSRARLTRGNLTGLGSQHPVIEDLQECLSIFRRVGDLNSVGQVGSLVAQAHARLGENKQAFRAYQAAIDAFNHTNDILNATENLVQAEVLKDHMPASKKPLQNEDQPYETLVRQAYLERFPDQTSGFLHRLFRGLTVFVILPVTYLLLLFLAFVQTLWTGFAESLWQAATRLIIFSSQILLLDLVTALPVLVLFPILALWIYDALFVIAAIFVTNLPLAFIPSRHQPRYFVIDPQTLGQYDQSGNLSNFMEWSKITFVASLDRSIWRSPLTLFSRFLVGDGEKILVVDGILNHYNHFKKQVVNRLGMQSQPARVHQLDFSLLDRRWTLAILAIVLLKVLISFALKYIELGQCSLVVRSPGGELLTLCITDFVFQFWKSMLFIGPLFVLAHSIYNRWVTRRLLDKRTRLGAEWTLWLAFLVMLILTLGELSMGFY